MTTVKADPYPWPYDGAFDPARTALVLIDWQVDFCGPGGYVDAMGYDLEPDAGRPGADHARCWTPPATPAWLIVHTREGHRPTSATARPTSCGARSASAPASATRARAAASWCAASRAGRSSPRSRRSTGELDHRQARQGRVLRHRPRPGAAQRAASPTSSSPASPPTCACTRRCVRPTTAATSACCSSDCTGATDYGNYEAAVKMVTMQGGVFGAVAPSDALLAGARAEPPRRAASPATRSTTPSTSCAIRNLFCRRVASAFDLACLRTAMGRQRHESLRLAADGRGPIQRRQPGPRGRHHHQPRRWWSPPSRPPSRHARPQRSRRARCRRRPARRQTTLTRPSPAADGRDRSTASRSPSRTSSTSPAWRPAPARSPTSIIPSATRPACSGSVQRAWSCWARRPPTSSPSALPAPRAETPTTDSRIPGGSSGGSAVCGGDRHGTGIARYRHPSVDPGAGGAQRRRRVKPTYGARSDRMGWCHFPGRWTTRADGGQRGGRRTGPRRPVRHDPAAPPAADTRGPYASACRPPPSSTSSRPSSPPSKR